MRTLSATLQGAQEGVNIPALVKIVLTKAGEDTQTFEEDRILSVKFSQESFSQKATVVLDNSDNALDDIDLQAFQGVISLGATTSEGAEYSAQPYLWAISQTFNSAQDHLTCSLELIGIPDRMALDHADAAYEPTDSDTDTVKTLIREICGDTGVTMLACFNHCPQFDITFDSEDSLIDSYQPKSTFRVRIGDDRLSKIKELLEKTGCQFRAEDDGEIHIFTPTKTGTTYNSSYTLAEGGHSFFAKSYRSRLVIPNKVTVKSWDDDSPSYTGSSTSAASYANMPIEETRQMTLASNAQAAAIAAAYIGNYELWCSAGSFTAPINVGLEVMDYINVVDSRGDDNRTGNVGRVAFYYDAPTDRKDSRWEMVVSFGDWTTVASKLASLGITGTELQSYFTRLGVGDLYAENITADQLNVVGINASGEIRLFYAEGDLDDIADGEDWGKVALTSITAGRIWLGAGTAVPEGDAWYVESGVIIDSGEGIKLFGDQISLRTYPTYADADADTNRQCYVGADGKIYAGAGAVYLDSDGISLKGDAGAAAEMLKIYDSTPTLKGEIYYTTASGLIIQTLNSADLYFFSVSDITLKATHGISMRAGGTTPTTATDNDTRIEADADIFIDAANDLNIEATADILIKATDGFSLRAGGTAPTTPGDGDIHIDGGDLVRIRAGVDETGNLALSAGVASSHTGTVLITAYYSGSADFSRITVDGGGDIDLYSYDDIFLDPQGTGTWVYPGSSANTNLGSNSVYYDEVNCLELDLTHSPTPMIDDPLEAVRGMKKHKKIITLETVKNEGLGRRIRKQVQEGNGRIEIDWSDKSTFPPQILNFPVMEDYDEAERVYQKLRTRATQRGKNPDDVIKPEPMVTTSVSSHLWLLTEAIQQLADRVEELEGSK